MDQPDPDPAPEPWQPANPVEAVLREALRRGDHARYCEVLAESVLLVRVVQPEDAGPGDRAAGRPVLGTVQLADGEVVVPAYTSPEALARPEAERAAGDPAPFPFSELVARWPDPRWVLVVDPGLPIASHLYGTELAPLLARVFAPVNQVERELTRAGQAGAVLATLAAAPLHLPVRRPVPAGADLADPEFPWWCREPGGSAAAAQLPVFTSLRRLQGCLGLEYPDLVSTVVDLRALAGRWPDPQWELAVNPGSPYSVTIPGEQLRRLPELLAT